MMTRIRYYYFENCHFLFLQESRLMRVMPECCNQKDRTVQKMKDREFQVWLRLLLLIFWGIKGVQFFQINILLAGRVHRNRVHRLLPLLEVVEKVPHHVER